MSNNCYQCRSVSQEFVVLFTAIHFQCTLTQLRLLPLNGYLCRFFFYLQDILAYEEIKLDWMFKISLMTDLANVRTLGPYTK